MQGEQPLPQQASKSGSGGGSGMGSIFGTGGGVIGSIASHCAAEQNAPMQFTVLPESDHPLVALRPIMPADIPIWFGYLSLPLVHEHTSWNPQAAAELAHYADPTHTPASALRLAIADRATGQMVGSIGFHTVSP